MTEGEMKNRVVLVSKFLHGGLCCEELDRSKQISSYDVPVKKHYQGFLISEGDKKIKESVLFQPTQLLTGVFLQVVATQCRERESPI